MKIKGSNMKKELVRNVSVALNHIENAYNTLKYYVDNESSLNETQRNTFYDYGIELANINILRLVNAKKGLLSVTNNMRVSDADI